ncbi:related to SH3 domain protein [Cephalotrichum gorgonifer]|uniref:Related to SH3 domain protein n=1 Tax=Cephalotrichum gorgonifer TaxID=2041049 RepID=A0AAE8N4J9_9PEZI|nr:related to SH3 domain protein [Cephalotrichum gorgonifer]
MNATNTHNATRQRAAGGERRRARTTKTPEAISAGALILSLLSIADTASAECISLKDSVACPAWPAASISTDANLAGTFSFLSSVTDTKSFDSGLEAYLKTTYITEKYQTQFGCGLVDFNNANDMYARFTKTTICSALVQSSRDICGVAVEDSAPACVDTCAEFAQSEALVSSDTKLCPNPGPNLIKLVRADFTTCGLPDDALSPSRCISGITNEPENCGFADSTYGLCVYCSAGGINATDSCCFNSDVDNRCQGVELPSSFPTMTFNVPSATATPGGDSDDDDGGLSGGAIAGIVIGSIVGALAIAGLLYLCIVMLRRRRNSGSHSGSVFNQPSPARQGHQSMSKLHSSSAPHGYEVLPGGRIARMSALEGHSGESPSHTSLGNAAAAGIISGRISSRRADTHSSSDEFDSPDFENRAGVGVLRPPPTALRRGGSLSSNSMIGDDPQSPTSAGGMSSAPGMTSQQSEQLPFFRDYYSQEDIHPGDKVAVLWAYQPRAADEFALERGDMLKVVGIWDDGWATGVLLDDRAEEWESRRAAQRDSGVSNTSGRRDVSPPVSGEIKALPLVCVCLPEHWKKTIDGEGSTETGSSFHQRTPSAFS